MNKHRTLAFFVGHLPLSFGAIGPGEENKEDTGKLWNLSLELEELGRSHSPLSKLVKVKPPPQSIWKPPPHHKTTKVRIP
jgi:hypothetical protein